ncbi:MAG: hypothetical protein ACOCZ8_00315 [Bacteroidota bacterium]
MNVLIAMVGVFSFILGLLYAFLGSSEQGSSYEFIAAVLYFLASALAIPSIGDRLMQLIGLSAAPANKVRILILIFLLAGAMAFFGGRSFGERLERDGAEDIEQLDPNTFEDDSPAPPPTDTIDIPGRDTEDTNDNALPPAAPEAVPERENEADV